MPSIAKKVIFITFLTSLFLNANSSYILKQEYLKPQAAEMINTIGQELTLKTGVNAYVLETNESFPIGYNLVQYSERYHQKMKVPYILYLFAPNALITEKTKQRGRIGIIPSSNTLKALYDYDAVRDAGLDVITVKDKNSIIDKYNIGVLQAYSELADQIAAHKNVKMEHTIPNETQLFVNVIRVILYTGLILIVWIFFIKPMIQKRGKND
ncbi:MAG TPA: hypothetical protein ENK82_00510 [Campylobacterales bacterium]|nr:hypothetical protein [Campylobacterales bacterium]